jgi:hypothetical protein
MDSLLSAEWGRLVGNRCVDAIPPKASPIKLGQEQVRRFIASVYVNFESLRTWQSLRI